MNINLFKESSATRRSLGEDLQSILANLDSSVAGSLLNRLTVEPHPTPLLVFTGYHSSGKSTLIEALTDRVFHVPIGSGVTTDVVTEYDWDGDVRLVDTPGVHAGRPRHDERAEQALQAADLVLFTVPVEMFDDTLVAHLRDVLGRLGKVRQTLIVITKAGTMAPPPEGVRDEAIAAALGSFGPIPWVECDAQYYLDGLDLADSAPAEAVAFIEASGLAQVGSRINSFAAQQGELGQLSQPLQLILAIALEASATLSEDPDEQAALTVLARQRSALTKKRSHLDDLLVGRSAQFRSEAVRSATQFVDAIESDERHGQLTDEMLAGHMSELNGRLSTALQRFAESVQQVLEVQFDDLTSEVLEIEASPYGRVALRVGEVEATDIVGREVEVTPGRVRRTAPPTWAGDLSAHLKQFHKFWGAGDGVKAAAGSQGHKVVLDVGHAFGKKFKPWEAVKAANTIGKAAKVGGVVIGIGLEAYSIYADERAAIREELARTERRRGITHEVLAQADHIVEDALRTVRRNLDEALRPELGRIDAVINEIHDSQTDRSALRERLGSVQRHARTALDRLATAAPSNQGQ